MPEPSPASAMFRCLFLATLSSCALFGCFDLNAPGDILQFEFGAAATPTCESAIDCPLAEICVDNQCTAGCLSNLDCPEGQICDGLPPVCVPAGECVTDSDCSDNLRCHPQVFVCAPCVDNFDCPGDLLCRVSFECGAGIRPCTGDDFACSGCTQDSECPQGSVCDSNSGGCVECVADGNCSSGLVCDTERQFCTNCVIDADCSDDPTRSACLVDDTGGRCVGCVDDGDCPEGTCDRDTLSCIGCLAHSDCDGDSHLCNFITGRCYDTSCIQRDVPPLIELTVEALFQTPFLAASPVAAPLLDTSGDGVIDRQDRATLLLSLSPEDTLAASSLALELDSRVLWNASSLPGTARGAAIGDVDGDLQPEAVVLRGDRLVAHSRSGSTRWTSSSRTDNLPTLYDVDNDGFAEVVAGGSLFNEAGARVWLGDDHRGGHSELPGIGFAAPINDEVVIVAGGTIYNLLGDTRCTEGRDGFAAMADVTGDESPELIVVSADASVRALSTDCELLWGPVAPPEATEAGGGPPAIADLDGDGRPEILFVAGPSTLAVFDGDGDLFWTQPLSDAHPAAGVTSGDLNGDGVPEVLVSDASSLKIFRGDDGVLLTEHPQGASSIPLNTPSLLDVDADRSTEIVVGAGALDPLDAVVIFADVRDRWSSSPNHWHQAALHPLAINDDLSIPLSPQPWWTQRNTFQARETQPREDPAPNISLSTIIGAVEIGDCPDRYTISVAVDNRGTLDLDPGISLDARFTNLDTGIILSAATSTRLQPGERELVSLTFDDLRGPVDIELTATRDDAQRLAAPECSLEDNTIILTDVGCPD